MILKAAIRAATRGRLTVFIYHRVVAEPDPLLPDEPDARRFAQELDWIGEWFQVLPLREAVQRLYDRSLPPGAAAITFDDGYSDNHDVALPLLRARGLSATFFVAPGFLDGGTMFNDRVIEAVRGWPAAELSVPGIGRLATDSVEAKRQAIARVLAGVKRLPPVERERAVADLSAACAPRSDLMMSTSNVRALHAAGMTIGAHTVNHPILTSLDRRTAEREIAESRERLESITGARVDLFAYPNGSPGADYGAEHVALVRRLGFQAAFSTAWGVADAGADRFQLPRFRPWDQGRRRYGLRLVRNACEHPAVAT